MSIAWNDQSWEECIARLNARIPADDIRAWVAPLHPVQRDDTLKLLAPNRYVLDYVNKNLRAVIEEALAAMDSAVRVVRVELGGHGTDARRGGGNGAGAGGAHTPTAAAPTPTPYAGGVMNPNYTFETHIEGASNQLARAAAMRVGAGERLRNYNPLFIHGEVGLGKTHLMQAAGHLMRRNNPGARIIYVRSELFVNDMVEALKSNAMDRFKRHYRSLDALLIDDIHFFARKTQSQEEFFHTFSALLEGQRQIIITSDRTPKAITDVDARLISRFGGGLTVGIEPPELETRVAILERKALEQGVALPHDVGFFVARVVRSNVRELEGALSTMLAKARFTGRDIDVDLAREVLRDQLKHQERRTSIESIQQIVAEYYKLRVSDLQSKKRSRDIVRPRQLAMYFAKEYTDLSLSQIGARFGGRDHTTVINACRKINELVQQDAKTAEDQRNLQRLFEA